MDIAMASSPMDFWTLCFDHTMLGFLVPELIVFEREGEVVSATASKFG